MKTAFIILLALACTITASSQQYNGGNPAIDLNKTNFVDNYFLKKADSFNLENVSGSPYISESFRIGRIILRNKKVFEEVPIRFNAYNNEMYFVQQGKTYVVDTALEVSYYEVPGDSTTQMIFRSGYPSIHNQSSNTYYQLTAGGNKVHLIKYIEKKLQEFKVMGSGLTSKKELVTTIKWYIYSEKDGIHEVKSNRKSIEKALPSYTKSVDLIEARHDLNLKKDDDMITLVQFLDKL